jgi:hypothetical protein
VEHVIKNGVPLPDVQVRPLAGAVATAPPTAYLMNTHINFDGSTYMTLDRHDVYDDSLSCQDTPYQVPGGWAVAPDDWRSRSVIASYTWGTACKFFDETLPAPCSLTRSPRRVCQRHELCDAQLPGLLYFIDPRSELLLLCACRALALANSLLPRPHLGRAWRPLSGRLVPGLAAAPHTRLRSL